MKKIFLLFLPVIAFSSPLNAAVDVVFGGFREVARLVPHNERVAYAEESFQLDVSPVSRSRILAIMWERLPQSVDRVWLNDVPEDLRYCITSSYLGEKSATKLLNGGWSRAYGNKNAVLWTRGVQKLEYTDYENLSIYRELLGTASVCLLIILLWKLSSAVSLNKIDWGACGAGLVLFSFYAYEVLNHTLTTPNGLGVIGGRAKFLYLEGLHLTGDGAYSLFLPFYPIGFSIIVWLSDCVSGGCGDWLIQLIPCTVGALVVITLLWECKDPLISALVVLFSCSCTWLKVVNGFYSESMMLLCLAIGMRIMARRKHMAWFVISLCALFRVEGVLLILTLWIVFILLDQSSHFNVADVVLSLLPSIMWWVIVGYYNLLAFDLSIGENLFSLELGRTLPAVSKGLTSDVLLLFAVGIGIAYCGIRKKFRLMCKCCVFCLLFLAGVSLTLGTLQNQWFEWKISQVTQRLLLSMAVCVLSWGKNI